MKLVLILILLITPAHAEDFTIVLFPDTQLMVMNLPDIWQTMPDWVVQNKESQNIKAVIGMGDIVEIPESVQFEEAQRGWDKIKDAGIVYAPVIGNHDYNNWAERMVKYYDMYFGPDYFSGIPWYKGSIYGQSNANYYVKMTIDNQEYLILALEAFPLPEVIPAAQAVLDENRNCKTILVTHGYLNKDGSLLRQDGRNGPDQFGLYDCYGGQLLWDNLIKKNSQIFLVVCGHQNVPVAPPFTAYSVAVNDAGRKVHQILCDYQGATNYGNGFMMLLKFNPHEIETSCYSAYLNSFDSSGAYSLKLDKPDIMPAIRLLLDAM